jgi:CxxC motif-containing protein
MSNPKTQNLLCIVCPEGCEINVSNNNGALSFEGGNCKRGEKYAEQEIVNPCRYFTTTVKLNGGDLAMLPVRSSEEIPKSKLMEAAQQVSSIEVAAPVTLGDVILEDILDTGISLIATKSCGKI